MGHNTAVDYFTKEREGERDWSHDYEPVDEEGYVTDLLAEHAVRFIDRHAGGAAPFFLYVPFSAPHSPLQAKEEDLPLYADLDALEPPRGWEESTAGRILDALDEHGVAENTLVLFFSDNGGSVGVGDKRRAGTEAARWGRHGRGEGRREVDARERPEPGSCG